MHTFWTTTPYACGVCEAEAKIQMYWKRSASSPEQPRWAVSEWILGLSSIEARRAGGLC